MQKYYDRETDQQAIFEEMQQCRDLETSRLIVVTGRRRIGKTELVRRSSQASPEPFVYLFASRVSHTVLIENWLAEIRSVLHPEIEPRCDRLSQVIEFLLRLGRSRRINVVIDECQDLNFIEPSFWSEVQLFWDLHHKQSQICLMMTGSVASAMRNIFQEYSEPLYGRVDRFIHVRPFPPSVLMEILKDHRANFSNTDLLALYLLTGGVPWFVAELMDRNATDLESMSRIVFRDGSKFAMDGEILLANEFRADATVNRTLLRAIANGVTRRDELQNFIGPVSVSGYLSRLENQFELIAQNVPVLGEDYRRVRYKLTDRYLAFWFAFILGNDSLLAQNNFEAARQDFLRRFDDFSGRALKQFFLERFRESQRFTTLGAWWDRRGNNEIDLIAQDNADNVWFFEVKRNALKYNRKTLEAKVSAFVQNNPTVRKCRLYVRGLSTQDMTTDVSTLLQTAELLVLPT